MNIMKTTVLRPLCGLLLASALIPGLHAQGTAFTYQGRLTDSMGPATGTYDLQFSIHDAASGGHAVAGPVLHSPVQVTDGLFSAALDFGANAFTGEPRWLEIAVRTNGAATFTTLEPRQPLTPTPYALYAPNAGNALLFDGQSPTAYAPATGSPAYAPATGSPSYVAKTGDTMTGPLNLPANGLVAGATQLALSAGNVGIGTATPAQKLDVVGVASAYGLISDGAPPEGGSLLLRNGGKTGNAAYEWALFNMTGNYGDSFQVWSYAANGSWWGPQFIIRDDGTTVLGPSGGNVGIGTSAPATRLHVQGVGDTEISIQSSDAAGRRWTLQASGNEPGQGRFEIIDRTLSVNRLTILKNGNVGIGTTTPTATLDVNGAVKCHGNVTILSRTTGATLIELGEGLDYAEGFDVADETKPEPGTVLVIDAEVPGKLTVSRRAYDRAVAGIVAGANGLGSAVRLAAGQFDCDVALAGRVYCKVDASDGPISPGDLLTTSSTPGHATVACDRNRSPGAILGKAMEPMAEGQTGRILVLVTLQ